MGNKKRNIIRELVSFNIIGIINTLITYGIYSLFIFLGFDYRISLLFDYIAGITISFFANKKYTFQYKENINIRMLLFMVVSYISVFFINMILLVIFIQKLNFNKYISQLIALAICISFSFIIQKFIVFRKNQC